MESEIRLDREPREREPGSGVKGRARRARVVIELVKVHRSVLLECNEEPIPTLEDLRAVGKWDAEAMRGSARSSACESRLNLVCAEVVSRRCCSRARQSKSCL